MIFHSLDFVIFFLVVVALYWWLRRRAQNALLLVASYFFYGYVHPWFLILIATSTVIDPGRLVVVVTGTDREAKDQPAA